MGGRAKERSRPGRGDKQHDKWQLFKVVYQWNYHLLWCRCWNQQSNSSIMMMGGGGDWFKFDGKLKERVMCSSVASQRRVCAPQRQLDKASALEFAKMFKLQNRLQCLLFGCSYTGDTVICGVFSARFLTCGALRGMMHLLHAQDGNEFFRQLERRSSRPLSELLKWKS